MSKDVPPIKIVQPRCGPIKAHFAPTRPEQEILREIDEHAGLCHGCGSHPPEHKPRCTVKFRSDCWIPL